MTQKTDDPKQGKSIQEREDIVSALVKAAQTAGADAADAVVFEGISNGVTYRLGKLEDLERSEGQTLGLRVMIGQRQAVVSSSDLSREGLAPLAERAVSMARLAPEDPYCGLAPEDRLATRFPELDLVDEEEPSSEKLVEMAQVAEEAALSIDGVTNSEGASAGWGRSGMVLATSSGFIGSYSATSHSVSCSVIAGEGEAMERDYEFSSARHGGDLDSPRRVGETAGRKATKRLFPRKVPSQSVPVVYDPRVSSSLLGHLSGSISGSGIARGTSFLRDKMGKTLFQKNITIVDDPHRTRGLASKPFDGEGVANRKLDLIKNGQLMTWLLDSSTARQLGLETTGHAARGTGGPPSPGSTNLYMEAGDLSPQDLIGDIKQGFYVTGLIGSGVNGITGDYSRGASGFWIEDGVISYPVNEITIAGNLKEMFLNMAPADDLEFKTRVNAPTIRVDGMTIAGT
jgi:PmbA protein